MTVRIKCCGMTRHEDVQQAARLGADAVGFVFTRRSKRFIDPVAAASLRAALPPFVDAVALVMDDEPSWVAHVIDTVNPDLVQFHGEESDEFCQGFGRRYLKAIAMGEGEGALRKLKAFPGATGLLLDGHGLGEPGGTGRTFDWSLMPKEFSRPLILAGGLTAENVGAAIAVARPWAVDVASGIEASPGIKDAAKMEHFIAAVRRGQGA